MSDVLRVGWVMAAACVLGCASALLVSSAVGATPGETVRANALAYTASTCEVDAFDDQRCVGDVARLATDGSGVPTKLTAAVVGGSGYHSPAWSPDGRKIAFVGREVGADAGTGGWGDSQNLLLMNANGSGKTNLTGHPPTSGHTPSYHDPAWFPGGRRIVYAKAEREGGYDADLYWRNVETGREVRLTFGGGNEYAPAVSPDGKKVAFMGVGDGDWEIYVMRLVPAGVDGNQPVRLTDDAARRVVPGFPPLPVQDHSPTWSPDGRQVAFSSDRDGDHEIYRMKTAPEGPKNRPIRLTHNRTHDHSPAWSPGGDRIAFAGGGDILTASAADGSRRLRLTENPWNDSAPSWRPLP